MVKEVNSKIDKEPCVFKISNIVRQGRLTTEIQTALIEVFPTSRIIKNF